MTLPFSLNPSLNDVPVYQPGRPIEDVARDLGLDASTIIKLASNENPLGPSPKALDAMKHVLANLNLYPDGNAFYLKKRLAAKLGVEIPNLILGNGSNEIIEFIGHALMGPGADVVASQYSFMVYAMVAKLFGANYISVPAKNLGHDLPAMLAAITPKTRVVFLANPNNPTGTLIPNDELLKFIAQVPKNILIAVDEAYVEFLENPPDLIASIRNGSQPNLILMRTFSKIFGLAGLRIGYGIARPELIAGLEKIRQPFNINAIAQAGALAALDDTTHFERTRENNREGLHFFTAELSRMKVEFTPSFANFILIRIGNGQKIFEELQKRGVIVRPMAGYQLPEYIRISIGTPAENERCVKNLRELL